MALPILTVNDIAEDGISLACELGADELALGPDDARLRGHVSLSVELVKVESSVYVTGQLCGVLVEECVRCLREFEEVIRLPFSVEYRESESLSRQPAKHSTRECPGALAGKSAVGEGDVYPLSGSRVELGEMLREQILLARAMHPVCREDCQGLCPVCGQDLNERRCGCAERGRETPFAVLQKRRDGPHGKI